MEKRQTIFQKIIPDHFNKPLFYTAFGIYLFLLIWIIALKCNFEWLPELGEYMRKLPLFQRTGWGIIPFYNVIRQYEKGVFFNLDYFCNILIYIPLGICLPFLCKEKRRWMKTMIIVAVSSLLFELIQLFTGFGGCDGTDWACNTIGGFIGLIIFELVKKIPKKAINIIDLSVSIIFAPVAIYALINTAINIQLYFI